MGSDKGSVVGRDTGRGAGNGTGNGTDDGGAGPARILVVEDDADINEVVCERLARDGYACTAAYSGSEALLVLERESFACIVTDLMLPGVPGERLVEALRERGEGVPIIVISARGEVAQRVALLRAGADDYLAKPFDLGELTVRVAAQLRGRGYARGAARVGSGLAGAADPTPLRHAAGQAVTGPDDGRTVLTAGRWVLDPVAHTFLIDGEPVALTNVEFAIVELLVAHPRTVFTKQQVYELCWGGPYVVDDNTVTAHMSKIRAKLRPSGTHEYIRTVWGLGFRLDVA